MSVVTEQLKERAQRYQAENPRAHAREVARALHVSEAELVWAQTGESVTALDGRFRELFEALPSLGDVKTMTRNEAAVIERWGTFERVEIDGPMGQVVGEEIDLRLFLRQWGSAFALTETSARGTRRSIQIFDRQGASVHKVYLEEDERLEAYAALVAARSADVKEPFDIGPPPPPATEKPDAQIHVEGLRVAWDAMKDTHELFGVLRRFGVTRAQALRLAGEARARCVSNTSFDAALKRAAETELPIMIFVGNKGAIQIHTGLVRRVERMHGWLNVLDPRLNLHVDDSKVAASWVVKKPTSDGIVTSLELYDAANESVLMMFGKRKPGQTEDPRWREVVASFEAHEATAPRGS